MFPTELLSKLWHSTSLERLNCIREHGAISPNPEINDNERWFTGNGETNYPYVRHIGGVSLFDFQNFNPNEYSETYPSSSWSSFVPECYKFETTIWIEINRKDVERKLISGPELLRKWKSEKKHSHNLMPLIECAYVDELEVSKFVQVLKYDKCTNSFSKLPKT